MLDQSVFKFSKKRFKHTDIHVRLIHLSHFEGHFFKTKKLKKHNVQNIINIETWYK
jgi:hypothetical protein